LMPLFQLSHCFRFKVVHVKNPSPLSSNHAKHSSLALLLVCICQLSGNPPSTNLRTAPLIQYSSYTGFPNIQSEQQFFNSYASAH
jgi:hypothetical protein